MEIIDSAQYRRANIRFSGIPAEEIRAALKAEGWLYSRNHNVWYPRNEAAENSSRFASHIKDTYFSGQKEDVQIVTETTEKNTLAEMVRSGSTLKEILAKLSDMYGENTVSEAFQESRNRLRDAPTSDEQTEIKLSSIVIDGSASQVLRTDPDTGEITRENSQLALRQKKTGEHLLVQRTDDGGWDYTAYDESFSEIDGGTLSDEEYPTARTIQDAAETILGDFFPESDLHDWEEADYEEIERAAEYKEYEEIIAEVQDASRSEQYDDYDDDFDNDYDDGMDEIEEDDDVPFSVSGIEEPAISAEADTAENSTVSVGNIPVENLAQEAEQKTEQKEPTFNINGESYTQTEIETLIEEDLRTIFRELIPEPYIEEVRLYQNPEKDGRINILVQYGTNEMEGTWREDDLFNALAEESIMFNGMEVDVNPITPEKSGTINEYLERLETLGATGEAEAVEKQAKLLKREVNALHVDGLEWLDAQTPGNHAEYIDRIHALVANGTLPAKIGSTIDYMDSRWSESDLASLRPILIAYPRQRTDSENERVFVYADTARNSNALILQLDIMADGEAILTGRTPAESGRTGRNRTLCKAAEITSEETARAVCKRIEFLPLEEINDESIKVYAAEVTTQKAREWREHDGTPHGHNDMFFENHAEKNDERLSVFDRVTNRYGKENKPFYDTYEQLKEKYIENQGRFIGDGHITRQFEQIHRELVRLQKQELTDIILESTTADEAQANALRYLNAFGNDGLVPGSNLYTLCGIGHYDSGELKTTAEETQKFIAEKFLEIHSVGTGKSAGIEGEQKRAILSFETFGYEGNIITVETDLRHGIPSYDIIGVADSAAENIRETIKAALKNSGLEFPGERVLQSLSPADLRKDGRAETLAMAASILNEKHHYRGTSVLVLGDLDPSGTVRPVSAVHAAVSTAAEAGISEIIVPKENVPEARGIPGVKVIGVSSLSELHETLARNEPFTEHTPIPDTEAKPDIEFNEELFSQATEINLDGYYDAARAIEIAIAGKNNLLLTGEPGSGKTMLASKLIPALSPALTAKEAQSVTRIHSIAGLIQADESAKKFPAFRMPHQTASIEEICGGGAKCRPGEISLAHNGTLFLDEAAEFRTSVLQMLRIPLESGVIILSRAGRSTVYPANLQLVMTANPCPCGNLGSESKPCLCSARAIDLYWRKFSNPLIDRIEIKQTVEKDESDRRRISVTEMRQHIENAIRIQRENPRYNARLSPQEIAEKCRLDDECAAFMKKKRGLTQQERANTLKLALTIANMDNRTEISIDDLREAAELSAPVFEKPHEFRRDQSEVKFAGFTYNSYYHSTRTRDLCHDVKQTESMEKRNAAIEEMANHLAKQIPEDGEKAFLIPAPQHTGNADYTLEIAQRIAEKNPSCAVLDVLKCEPHEPLYEQKKEGNRTPKLQLHTPDSFTRDTAMQDGARLFFIDNVISTGNTFNEANELFDGKLFPLVYAVSDFASFSLNDGRVSITDTKLDAPSNEPKKDEKNSPTTETKKPFQITEDDLDICRMMIPPEQYKLTLKLTQGDDGEFFKQKIREIARAVMDAPGIGDTDEMEQHPIVLRYFHPAGIETLVTEIGNDGEAFGFQCLNGDYELAEWGYIDLNEIRSIDGVEVDYHVPAGTTVERWLYRKHPDMFPQYAQFAEAYKSPEDGVSWEELGLRESDFDRSEAPFGGENEREFKEWAVGLYLEEHLDLRGFDTGRSDLSDEDNSRIGEQKWLILDDISRKIVSGELKNDYSEYQKEFDRQLQSNVLYKELNLSAEPEHNKPKAAPLPYRFYVKDIAESEQMTGFEPITNLTAAQAVDRLLELDSSANMAGIGITVPGSTDHGEEFDGSGVAEFYKADGKYTYADTPLDKQHSIQDNADYISAVNDILAEFRKRGIEVVLPQERSTETPKSEKTERSKTKHEIKQIREQCREILRKPDGEITEADKAMLAQYEGGGGLDEENRTNSAILNEFYTPKNLVEKVWEIADHYAPKAVTALEPSSGPGRFADGRPNNTFTMYEKDEVAARINKILHPSATIIEGVFQKQFFDENERFRKNSYELPKYDLVIGNPPYGAYSDKYKGLGEGTDFNRYEEYFIMRGLESLNDENSLLAFIVPSGFLSTESDKQKAIIAGQGELVDAYRLPEGTFPTTQVGTDIIVMRKTYALTPGEVARNASLMSDGNWFDRHPEKILGEVRTRTNRFGKEEEYVAAHEGLTIQDELDKISAMLAETTTANNNAEKIELSEDEWRVMDEIANAAKMDWWFEEYGMDGGIPSGGVSKEDLENLATSFYDSNFVAKEFEESVVQKARDCFQKYGIQYEEDSAHDIRQNTGQEGQKETPERKIPEDEIRAIYAKTYPNSENRAEDGAEKFIAAWKSKNFNGLTNGLAYPYPEMPPLRELFEKTENLMLPDEHNERLIAIAKYADYDSVPPQFKFKNWNEALRHDLTRGSGFENGKRRIHDFFRNNLSKKERAKFLKNEYGIGGVGYAGYTQNHDSKGIKLDVIINDTLQTRLFTWEEVADTISYLMLSGEYYKTASAQTETKDAAKTEHSPTPAQESAGHTITQTKGIMTAQEFSRLYGKSFDALNYSVWSHANWEGCIQQENLSQEELAYIKKSPDYVQEKPGQWTHKVLFGSGDIYKKIDDQKKLLSAATIGENAEIAELHKKNISLLETAKKPPINIDDIHIALNSTLAEEFMIPHKYGSGMEEKRSLAESFILWAQGETIDSQKNRHSIDYATARISREEMPDNISWYDIVDFIDKKKVIADKTSSWSYGRTEEEIKRLRKERRKAADEKRMARSETANRLFDRYIHEGLDETTKERFLDEYNRRFNSYVIPKYENLPLYIDGMSAYKGKTAFRLYDQQLKGVARLSAKGNGLLAYDVGVGKTATGIVANINQIQAGRSRRPLIIVPNSVYSKWVADIKQLFPKIMVNELYNFSGSSIDKFRDKDDSHALKIPVDSISVCTYEALKHITFTEHSCTNELFSDFSKLLSADFDGSENENAAMEEKIMSTIGAASSVNSEDYVFFEKCGFDNITVDEAHNFKNLWVVPKPNKKGESNEYSGIPSGTPSKRAIKLFAMTQLVQRHNDNRNVFLLTATPFTNSPLEVYSMLTYIGRKRLVESGIYSLRDFMNQFAHTKLELAVNPKGEIDYKQVMKDWKELPALQNLLTEFIDKVDGEEAGIIRPKKFSHVKELDLSPLQKQIMAAEEERMLTVTENSGAVLEAMNNMRVALVSPALLNKFKYEGLELPGLQDLVESSPKLKFVCDTIIDMYKEHPDMGQFMYMPLGKEGHGIVADYLIDRGIPKSAVQVINGEVNGTPEKKEKITSDFNNPKSPLKIIIGGKNTCEGIDLNGNSFVMYNCSLGWNPSETIQAEGRIWRQGNMQGHVHAVYPVMTDSIDSLLYQKHDEKRSRINDLWTYKGNMLNVEDINPEELKFDLIKDPNKRVKLIIDEETKDLNAKLAKINLRQESFNEIIERQAAVIERLAQSESDLAEHRKWQSDAMTKGERIPEYLRESIKDDIKNVETFTRQKEIIAEKLAGMNLRTEQDIRRHASALSEERRAVEKEIKEAKKKIPDLVTELEKKLTEQKLVAHPIEQQRKELEESILGNLRPMTDIIGETKKDSEIQVEKSDEPYINEKGEYYLFDIDAPAGIMAEVVEPYDNGELDDLSITPAQIRATKTEQAKIVRPILRGEKTGLWTAFKEFKQHGVFDIQGKTIALTPSGKISRTGWKQLQAAASIYRSKKFETFRYILLDRNDGEIKDQLAITSYMPNATVASLPENDTIKKVLTRAEQNDCLIALVHNHPSGDTTPSVQDTESTEILFKVMRRADGLNRFAGHIILDHENFSLYTPKDGWQTIETSRNGKDPLIKEGLPEWGIKKITGGTDLVSVAMKLNDTENWSDDFVPVVFSNADCKICGLQYLHKDFFMQDSETVGEELRKSAMESGATQAFPIFSHSFVKKLQEKELSLFESNIKDHVERGAFTDAAIGSTTAVMNFGLEKGEKFEEQILSRIQERTGIQATWKPSIAKELFAERQTSERARRSMVIER